MRNEKLRGDGGDAGAGRKYFGAIAPRRDSKFGAAERRRRDTKFSRDSFPLDVD